MTYSKNAPIQRALRSLLGLTVGDQFGELFFVASNIFEESVRDRRVPDGQWQYTDDTEMALSVVVGLSKYGRVLQDELMWSFAERHDMSRGYGPSMRRVLDEVRGGRDWRVVIGGAFEGQGSYGNGSAMRAGPLGAFFAFDLHECVKQAGLSSSVTHTHPEAEAGAIAVAVAATLAYRGKNDEDRQTGPEYLKEIAAWVPESEVRSRIVRAAHLPEAMSPETAASILGNGKEMSAQDTVPFSVWCAAKQLGDYESALWWAVSAGGDRDTICAIVGSIVALSTRVEIPDAWLDVREEYPRWFTVT